MSTLSKKSLKPLPPDTVPIQTIDLHFMQQQFCVELEKPVPDRWNTVLPACTSAHEANALINDYKRLRVQSPIPGTTVHYRIVKVCLPFTVVG